VLSSSRVEVESRRIRHVASGVIRNNRNVIAYLALVRVTFEGIKRVAHRDVRRPRHTGIRAPGIE
jgi:hypothetical protein